MKLSVGSLRYRTGAHSTSAARVRSPDVRPLLGSIALQIDLTLTEGCNSIPMRRSSVQIGWQSALTL